ncbi:YfcC family protein [uncultured Cetobacterium sp.]|uniref:YfcC family protein n=1 Tax=uncultured Cetobacterium sp. TaxID=527638 RepID=UPI0026089717|nr:YfcC family protein [uncultured Cetobacterium sp.]
MKQKKKRSFPTAFTVLFIILVLASILTYIIPSGRFSRLTYNNQSNEFVVTDYKDKTHIEPATQQVLDKLHIQLDLNKFKEGIIKKPLAIPGTYTQIKQHPQGILEILKAPVQGVMDTVDIMIFVLILGGIIGLVNKVGAFEAGIGALSKKTKGKEFMLVTIIFFLTALGGTTFGLAEETIAFYPILMPIFLVSGFDAITCIAAIYLGSSIGTTFSTVNPFSVVIASNAAGISFTDGLGFRVITLIIGACITLGYIYLYAKKVRKDPTCSLTYDTQKEIHDRFLKEYDNEVSNNFTIRKKLILTIFSLAFLVLIWGVSRGGWWFEEMSALFLGVSIIIMGLSGLSEKEAVNTFIAGAADLVGVALTIGLARSINIVLDQGFVSDTLLHYSINLISGMSGWMFSITQLFVFSFLGLFIPSSSGLAVLTMPIMAPLADSVGLSREIVINAYNWGQGLMAFITPTGLILVTLEMAGATFDKWLKYVLPLLGIIGIYSIVMLIISTLV